MSEKTLGMQLDRAPRAVVVVTVPTCGRGRDRAPHVAVTLTVRHVWPWS